MHGDLINFLIRTKAIIQLYKFDNTFYFLNEQSAWKKTVKNNMIG
jgi:hypothetical protein